MHTRQRDRGVAFVRALAADPTAVLRAPADASAAEANASEAAAPDDATSRLGALAHAASVQKPKRKTKLVSDSPEARRARAKVIFAVAKKRRFEHEQRAAALLPFLALEGRREQRRRCAVRRSGLRTTLEA